jgi:hypothetical protein
MYAYIPETGPDFSRGCTGRKIGHLIFETPHRRTIRELTSASLSITEQATRANGAGTARSLPRSTAIPYAWVSTDVYLPLGALHAQLLLRPYAPSQDTLSSSWNQNNSKRPSSSLTSNAGYLGWPQLCSTVPRIPPNFDFQCPSCTRTVMPVRAS